MSVLFMTYAYPPQKYPRSAQISQLVQYLHKKIEINVITSLSENSGDTSLLEFTPLDKVIFAKKSRFTSFIERMKGERFKKSILPDSCYLWHFDLYFKALEFMRTHTVETIVTFGQPMSSHIAGLKLKKKFPSIKWIAHFSDPWVDNPFNQYNFWLKCVNKYYQKSVFKTADKLLFTSQETIELCLGKESRNIQNKSSVVSHAFNENLYSEAKKSKGAFIIRYLGNFYGQRQPFSFLEALPKISKDFILSKNIRVEFIGSTSEDIKMAIQAKHLQDLVSLHPPVNYLESLKLMKSSDLLLIIDAQFESSPFLPSKLVDYIGADKPIFGITPLGASQRLIEEMGFLAAHPNNSNVIAEKLISMINGISQGKFATVPKNIRNRFHVDIVGQKFLDLIAG